MSTHVRVTAWTYAERRADVSAYVRATAKPLAWVRAKAALYERGYRTLKGTESRGLLRHALLTARAFWSLARTAEGAP